MEFFLVGGEGLEPPEAEAVAFTARCNCHYTNRPRHLPAGPATVAAVLLS
jgi:hypothetical protein